ncbi:MAG: hypothetical protein AAGI13_12845 [Pseudomonadota bacterium]
MLLVSKLAPLKIALVLAALSSSVMAAEFRRATPIARPTPPPPNFQAVSTVQPLDRDLVERAVRGVFADWNRGDLSQHLSERFFDGDRLTDQIALSAPRDAQIRLLALQSVSTLEQFISPGPDGAVTISRVSAIATTAVEFNDPATGFQRFEGTHEYQFRITTRSAE